MLYTREAARQLTVRPLLKFYEMKPRNVDGVKTQLIAAINENEAWDIFCTTRFSALRPIRADWLIQESQEVTYGERIGQAETSTVD